MADRRWRLGTGRAVMGAINLNIKFYSIMQIIADSMKLVLASKSLRFACSDNLWVLKPVGVIMQTVGSNYTITPATQNNNRCLPGSSFSCGARQ